MMHMMQQLVVAGNRVSYGLNTLVWKWDLVSTRSKSRPNYIAIHPTRCGHNWGCPTHRPTRPYPTGVHPIRLLQRSAAGPEFQNPTPAGWFRVPSFKTRETRPAWRHQFWRILHWFWRVFSLIWQISATKTIRSGIDTPDPEILDMIWGKNNRIWRNPHRILARSGEISPILAVFLCFSSGFGLTRNQCHPPENRPAKPDPLNGSVAG